MKISRRQAIIWTNAGTLLTGPLGTNFSEILIEIHIYLFKNAFENVIWEMAAIFSQPCWVNKEDVQEETSPAKAV